MQILLQKQGKESIDILAKTLSRVLTIKSLKIKKEQVKR